MISLSNKTLALLFAVSFFSIVASANTEDAIVSSDADFAAIEDKAEGVVSSSNILIAGDDEDTLTDTEEKTDDDTALPTDTPDEDTDDDAAEPEDVTGFDESEHVFNLENDDDEF